MTHTLLLELFGEEIPARWQVDAGANLQRLVTESLKSQNIAYGAAENFTTPRRLILHIEGIAEKQKDREEIKKGPSLQAAPEIIQAFLKKYHFSSVEEAKIIVDPTKGPLYAAVHHFPGKQSDEILRQVLPEMIRSFPWPKSMRWGEDSSSLQSLRWVRPLHNILCLFGFSEGNLPLLSFQVGHLQTRCVTYGHRSWGFAELEVKNFLNYQEVLAQHNVLLSPEERCSLILQQGRTLAAAEGLELIEDPELIQEISGLVEWPVVLLGTFDPIFLTLPEDVIRTSLREHQKCLVLRSPNTHHLAHKFIIVANISAKDGGQKIIEGNNRVVRARLSDAKFFFDQDCATPLQERIQKLNHITFHEKLGTQGLRLQRLKKLAYHIALQIGAPVEEVVRAAELAKSDLPSGMVNEFPILQGIMGKYYARHHGELEVIAQAIEEHYKPQGPYDSLPTHPVSICVAIADKIDLLVGFWRIQQKPTGSRDPYGLRRAALGIIRIILTHALHLPLRPLIRHHWAIYDTLCAPSPGEGSLALPAAHEALAEDLLTFFLERFKIYLREQEPSQHLSPNLIDSIRPLSKLSCGREVHSVFIEDKNTCLAPRANEDAFLKEEGYEDLGGEDRSVLDVHSLALLSKASISATPKTTPVPYGTGYEDRRLKSTQHFSPEVAFQKRSISAIHHENERILDDFLIIFQRVEALYNFLTTENGKNLLASYKRAANILKAERKKEGLAHFTRVADSTLFVTEEERFLSKEINRAKEHITFAAIDKDFTSCVTQLAGLRRPVDDFFDRVTVNDPQAALRYNRLCLVNDLCELLNRVADFSKIDHIL